jgi:ParB family chromosome partitioning protein
MEIELARIELNPDQPREHMDPEALRGLADSIRSAGVLQPVVVRERGDGMYELVVGERRLRAAQTVGLEAIPALVRDVADEEMLELALIENIQREDLNPIEKARAIRRMIEKLSLTQEQAGQKLGLERPTIANFLRLLDLPGEVQEMVSRGTVSGGHARAILALEDNDERVELARAVADRGLSVRETERLAAGGTLSAGKKRIRPEPAPQIKRLEGLLREALGTKVELRQRGRRGKIIVHFESPDDFDRLFEIMTGFETSPGGPAAAEQ